MAIIDPTSDILLEIYLKGRRILRPGNEVYLLFWKVQYAWLLPTDFYRYEIEDYHEELYPYLEKVGKYARDFGLYLHMRTDRHLTLTDLRNLEENSVLSNQVLQRRACDFNKIFKAIPENRADLRPFKHDKAFDRPGQPQSYRMDPYRDYLVVKGIDPKIKLDPEDQIDWPKFEQKPKSSKK
jgi:hypothetical protein